MTTSPATKQMKFAVEEDDGRTRGLDWRTSGYKHIHKAGCRDLRDPEEFTASTVEDFLFQASGMAVCEEGDSLADLKAWGDIAPCAMKMVGRLTD